MTTRIDQKGTLGLPLRSGKIPFLRAVYLAQRNPRRLNRIIHAFMYQSIGRLICMTPSSEMSTRVHNINPLS